MGHGSLLPLSACINIIAREHHGHAELHLELRVEREIDMFDLFMFLL
jgi:hypothetical protein